MSILVNNITKLYGTQKALDNVSLEIRPGEVIGLLGPNGAGKSTLMKILTCYIPPTEGYAKVCGFDVMEESIEVRRRIGYLPENNPLYLDLYVKEFLAFIAGVHGLKNPAKRIAEMIEITGLQREQHKKLGALSKGYRQRVGLAQALINDPEVLILDEPTSGLDPNQLLEIRNLIREVGKEKTVMLSTHIMQEVEAICSRAIIIHKGNIVADDSTHNLQNIVYNKVMVRVEFSSPVEKQLLLGIGGVTEVLNPDGRGTASATWLLSSDPANDIRGDIFRFAVEGGLTVLSMNREEQKLEEVFQELTKN
jgi:ABC-2 type transport system ATP-binding protein